MDSHSYPKWHCIFSLPDDMDARINRVEFVVRRRRRNRDSENRNTSSSFVRDTRATPVFHRKRSRNLAKDMQVAENHLPVKPVKENSLANRHASQADASDGSVYFENSDTEDVRRESATKAFGSFGNEALFEESAAPHVMRTGSRPPQSAVQQLQAVANAVPPVRSQDNLRHRVQNRTSQRWTKNEERTLAEEYVAGRSVKAIQEDYLLNRTVPACNKRIRDFKSDHFIIARDGYWILSDLWDVYMAN